MSRRLKLLSALLCSSILMAGCSDGAGDSVNLGGGTGGDLSGGGSGNLGGGSGGSGGSGGAGNEGSGGEGDGQNPALDLSSSASFLNLQVYEGFDQFSGENAGGLFQGNYDYAVGGVSPYIKQYVINPVSATDLSPITDASVNDYVTLVDDQAIGATESYPLFQKILGSQTLLRTALVFDLSDSMIAAGVDIDALVAEAKQYIVDARASSNQSIAAQQFVIWAFGREVRALTPDALGADNDSDVNDALDQIAVLYKDRSLGGASNLNRAIVQAIGRYKDDTYDFRFDGEDVLEGDDGNNDLVDTVRPDFSILSQVVVFSSGGDTFKGMTTDLMEQAIESQGLSVFDTSTGALNVTTFKYKPVIYYVVGGTQAGGQYDALANKSEEVGALDLNGSSYDFSSDLVSKQISAMTSRVDSSRQYMYRFAFLPRVGDHEILFSTNTVGYSTSISTELKEDDINPNAGAPSEVLDSVVEITGPNGEYIVKLPDGGGFTPTISFTEVSTFAPATRWIPQTYNAASDYSWAIVAGTGTGSDNPDGSYTLSSKAPGTDLRLRLTNNALGASGLPYASKNVQDIIITD